MAVQWSVALCALLCVVPVGGFLDERVSGTTCEKDVGFEVTSHVECQQYALQNGLVMYDVKFTNHNRGCNIITDCTQLPGGDCAEFPNGSVMYINSDIFYVDAVCETYFPCLCKDSAKAAPPLPTLPANIVEVAEGSGDKCPTEVSMLVCLQYATSKGLKFFASASLAVKGCVYDTRTNELLYSINGDLARCGVEKDVMCVCATETTAPLTAAPPTEPPLTSVPTVVPTQAPKTAAPLTLPPATQPPATQPPLTQPPATQPPATQPPLTQPPATQPPLTQPPATQPPLTQPPATLPPVTQPPATQPPLTQPPATQPPLTQPPVTQPPLTQPPATQPPLTVSPPTQPPATQPTQPPATQPPATVSPPTPAPDTFSPATPWPATQSPATPAPLTVSPPTPAPTTPWPATLPPQTLAPLTVAPTSTPTQPPTAEPTAVPTSIPTVAPQTLTPPRTGQVIGGNGGGVVAGVTVLSAASAASAGRMALLAGVEACRLDVEHLEEPEYLPWTLHPIRLTVHGSEWVGAVVANLAICVVASFLGWAAVYAVRFIAPTYGDAFQQRMDVQGMLRMPSAVLFLFTILYQGTSLASLRMMVAGTQWYYEVVGGFGILVCLYVPVHLLLQFRKNVPMYARYALDDHNQGKMTHFLLGKGEWVSTEQEYHWVQRYSVIVRPYKQRYVWWVCIEYLSMLLLSAASSARLNGHVKCCALKTTSAFILFLLFAAGLYIRPYHRPRDNVLAPLINLTQTISVVLVATGFCKNDSLDLEEWMFRRSEEVLVVSVVMLLIKLCLDLVAEIYVFYTGRRVTMQHAEYLRKPGRGAGDPILYGEEAEMIAIIPDDFSVLEDLSPRSMPASPPAYVSQAPSLLVPPPSDMPSVPSLADPLICRDTSSTSLPTLSSISAKVSSVHVERSNFEKFLCTATEGGYQEQVSKRLDSEGNPITRVLL